MTADWRNQWSFILFLTHNRHLRCSHVRVKEGGICGDLASVASALLVTDRLEEHVVSVRFWCLTPKEQRESKIERGQPTNSVLRTLFMLEMTGRRPSPHPTKHPNRKQNASHKNQLLVPVLVFFLFNITTIHFEMVGRDLLLGNQAPSEPCVQEILKNKRESV